MLKREADKIQSAVADPDTMVERVRDFYGKFADTFRSALLPACQMHCAMTGDSRAPMALADELVAAHIATSRRDLEHCAPDEVAALVEKWHIERLNVIPDLLQRGTINGA